MSETTRWAVSGLGMLDSPARIDVHVCTVETLRFDGVFGPLGDSPPMASVACTECHSSRVIPVRDDVAARLGAVGA